jgi:hypothetical protein
VIHCLQPWQSRQDIQLHQFAAEVKEVIKQQHKIGWLDFLECLPAKGQQMLQRRYYWEEGIHKSSKKWLQGLLLQLHHLGHKQWRHRCDVKNNITKPTEQELLDTIHIEIEQQFELGYTKLLTGDQALLDYNILHLLDKSLVYKKGWLAQVWAARQRAQRIAEHNEKLILQAKEAS